MEQLGHMDVAREVCWGPHEASLLNEDDKSAHNPTFGSLLRGKELTKTITDVPIGSLSEHFLRGPTPDKRHS
jgi:hypothetical protein